MSDAHTSDQFGAPGLPTLSSALCLLSLGRTMCGENLGDKVDVHASSPDGILVRSPYRRSILPLRKRLRRAFIRSHFDPFDARLMAEPGSLAFGILAGAQFDKSHGIRE